NYFTSHIRVRAISLKRCVGCGHEISDQILLFVLDGYWHISCLKCSCCRAQLAEIGTSCFSKSGMVLCRKDYIRLFGNSGVCRACSNSIPAGEMVMKTPDHVYHVKCFACSICHRQLMPGDWFHCENGRLFCDHDRPIASESLTNGTFSSPQDNNSLWVNIFKICN
uniref:LIM zinc-binding domain-containing protein n=1 Tax=Electrophorus electricus TaxID=8005 RepID=A0A4W4H8R6_ELEEL